MGCISGKQFKPEHHDPIMTIRAALLIQRWYRAYVARCEMRNRYTWSIFTSLEYAGEQDQAELYNFYNALLMYMPDASRERTSGSASADDPSLNFTEADFENDDAIDRNYMGPHVEFPMTSKDVDNLINLFRKRQDNHLHAKYVAAIFNAAISRLKQLPNLNNTTTSISGQITVVGDLHGKLDDLMVIFYKNGLPSMENPYIFNGDFVDRGKKSIEVFLVLLACFLVFPGGVFLNRGNHEDAIMNLRYGFTAEVQNKYKSNADKLLQMIDEVYRWLPLGSTINNKVFIVHGGLSDRTNLTILNNLNRSKYVSILRPPVDVGSEDDINKDEWQQIFDIMWSDPKKENGCEPNALRGAGTYFGPDVSLNFLRRNNLKYLVRSHECKPGGYEYMHNGLVITIFSASNYYAMGSNKGAYLKFNQNLEPRFVQFVSAASRSSKLTIRQRVGVVESSALRELGARLHENRAQLQVQFESYDPNKTGKITLTEWCAAMGKATNFNLPWRLMRDKLAPMPPNSPINIVDYRTTLELIDTDVIRQQTLEQIDVVDTLYNNKSNLEAIFHLIDKDHSGQISLEEFSDACLLLEKYMPKGRTHEQLMEMCKLMDINHDGLVDLNEFLEAFRLSSPTGNNQNPAENKSKPPAKGSRPVSKVANSLKKKVDTEHDIDPRDHVANSPLPRNKLKNDQVNRPRKGK